MNKTVIILLILSLSLLLAACGDSLKFEYDDIPETGDVGLGATLFQQSISGEASCVSCHSLSGEDTGSPSLEGFGERAGERVSGQSAREYAFYAIADPGRHIVDGFGNAMPTKYDDKLTAQQIADIMTFILSL